MRSTPVVSSLLLLVLLALTASCRRCDDAPPPAPAVALPPMQTVSAPGWTVEVPADWRALNAARFVGPDRANILIESRFSPAPLELIAEETRRTLAGDLTDFAVLREHLGRVHALRAWELLNAHTHAGQPVHLLTVVLDAGAVRYVLTCSVVSARWSADAPLFAAIVQSFRADLVTPPTPHAADADDRLPWF